MAGMSLPVQQWTHAYVIEPIIQVRDNMLVMCIALLEALDYLQERIHLSFTIVRRLKGQLRKIIEGSLLDRHSRNMDWNGNGPQATFLARKIADSEAWARTTTEDIIGFVSSLVSAIKWINKLMAMGMKTMYYTAIVFVQRIPGVPASTALFYRIYGILENALVTSRTTLNMSEHNTPRPSPPTIFQYGSKEDAHLTAVVLDYHEKDVDENLVNTVSRRIHRMMHFQVSLRPFEATVRLPDPNEEIPTPTGNPNIQVRCAVTPRSIPASPHSRTRVQTAFSNFSDDVLYKARDQLRRERAAMVPGEQQIIPTFNPIDSHEDIFLSCGLHSASKLGTGLYRSCRATKQILRNRYVYFQMSISALCGRAPVPSDAGRVQNLQNGICVGLSTSSMPLNTLVGTWKQSIGFYSSGHIIAGSQWKNYVSVDASYGSGNTVGVLVYIDEANSMITEGDDAAMMSVRVQFLIDGRALRDCSNEMACVEFMVARESQLYPTLTLFSSDTQVLSHFSAADVVLPHIGELAVEECTVWCLDDVELPAY